MFGKLCPKVILEGTRLTHKTDIADDLSIFFEEQEILRELVDKSILGISKN